MSGIPCHTELLPDRIIYLSGWFVLSVLFMTLGETSVVRTPVQHPPSHRLPPHRNVSPTSFLILSVYVAEIPLSHRSPAQ